MTKRPDIYILDRSERSCLSAAVTVHEHRAPTDHSVALLREMEKAAEDKRIASISLEGNTLHGVVEVFQDMSSFGHWYVAVIDLNGKRIQVKHFTQDMSSEQDGLLAFRDEVAKEMANQVLIPAMQSMGRRLSNVR